MYDYLSVYLGISLYIACSQYLNIIHFLPVLKPLEQIGNPVKGMEVLIETESVASEASTAAPFAFGALSPIQIGNVMEGLLKDTSTDWIVSGNSYKDVGSMLGTPTIDGLTKCLNAVMDRK